LNISGVLRQQEILFGPSTLSNANSREILVPSWYRLARNHRLAKELITPIVTKHVQHREKPMNIKENRDSTLLTWMSDFAADERQADPENLAHRQNMLGLGSIYTIRAALANIFYDLCAHPEFIPELQEEVEQVILEEGEWNKAALAKMWKIDSFLVESQRVNPPNLSKSKNCVEILN